MQYNAIYTLRYIFLASFLWMEEEQLVARFLIRNSMSPVFVCLMDDCLALC